MWKKCPCSLEGTRLLVIKGAAQVAAVSSVIPLLTLTGLEEKQTGINLTSRQLAFRSLSSEVSAFCSESGANGLQSTSALPYKYFSRGLHPSNTSQKKLLTEFLPIYLYSVVMS